jgi:hypothetical protein
VLPAGTFADVDGETVDPDEQFVMSEPQLQRLPHTWVWLMRSHHRPSEQILLPVVHSR